MKDKYRDSESPKLDAFLDGLDTYLIKTVGDAWDYSWDMEDDYLQISLHLLDPDQHQQPKRLIDIYG